MPAVVPVQTTKITFDRPRQDGQITKDDVIGVPEAFMLYNVMSARECEQFLQMIEEIGMCERGGRGREGRGERGGKREGRERGERGERGERERGEERQRRGEGGEIGLYVHC